MRCVLPEEHSFKLYQERFRINNIRRESFPLRITKVWNQLPGNVISAPECEHIQKQAWQAPGKEDFLYNYRAPIPGEHRAEDRIRRVYDDLTIED